VSLLDPGKVRLVPVVLRDVLHLEQMGYSGMVAFTVLKTRCGNLPIGLQSVFPMTPHWLQLLILPLHSPIYIYISREIFSLSVYL